MAQDPTGGFVDDDDLPATAAQPRDPASQRFLQNTAQPAPRQQFSRFALAKAQEYGVTVGSMSPDALDEVLASIDKHRTGAAHEQARRAREAQDQAAAAARSKPNDPPPVDWGDDDQGRPLTEEQAKALYPRPLFKAIKDQHRLDQVAAQQKAISDSLEQDRQQRSHRQVVRQIHSVLATRPDLFGANPGQAAEGTPEAERYAVVTGWLSNLVAAGKQTNPTADAQRALQLFGPAVAQPAAGKKPPAASPSPVDVALGYQNGELARPTGRRGSELVSRRQALIDQEQQRQRENGSHVAATSASEDDDDDLPE